MDRLKDLLDRDGVEYNEKLFDTDKGITGLGDEPFVRRYPIGTCSGMGKANWGVTINKHENFKLKQKVLRLGDMLVTLYTLRLLLLTGSNFSDFAILFTFRVLILAILDFNHKTH